MKLQPRFERTHRIRFSDCDPAGIVFFPQYMVMFNGLLEDWITDELGISFAALLGARRIGLPTVSINCEFSAICRMGDEVTLTLNVERVGNKSLSLLLECWQHDLLCVRSRQILVTTDLQTHGSIAFPPDLRLALARYKKP